MTRSLVLMVLLLLSAGAQTPPTITSTKSPQVAEATIKKNVESCLRKLFAWGPTFQIKIGPLRGAPVPGFYEAPVEIGKGEESDSAVVYVSKDGRYLLRGDVYDTTSDPMAAVRSQIHLANNPARGPADARVTVVEYSDYQCPYCRQLQQSLRALASSYPQVRFVFKDFPLVKTHPWAMTAALAARCAYIQDSRAFWKLHDAIFDKQDAISLENVRQKMLEFAAAASLNTRAFRTCMASTQSTRAVEANIQEAHALKVTSTPTVFVNGRRMSGLSRTLLSQYIDYDLAASPQTVAAK
jgi:protein-disulfide isomerase